MSDNGLDRTARHDELMREYTSVSADRRSPVREQLERIWGAAIKRTGDPLLPVHLGELFRPSLSLFTSILMWSATVEECLRNLVRHWLPHSVAARFSNVTLEESLAVTRLRYQMADGEASDPHDVEFRFCRLITFLRNISDMTLRPALVRFQHAQPPYHAALAAVFMAPLLFDQPFNALEFGPEMLGLPVLMSATQRQTILRIGEQMLAGMTRPGNLPDLVRESIRIQLPSGEFGMRAIAPRLGMSPRTLQRHLQRGGTSFQELLDDARKGECVNIMQGDHCSNTSIADRLGYSNVANFHRAFRRWFGKTPNQMRRELLSAAVVANKPPVPDRAPVGTMSIGLTS